MKTSRIAAAVTTLLLVAGCGGREPVPARGQVEPLTPLVAPAAETARQLGEPSETVTTVTVPTAAIPTEAVSTDERAAGRGPSGAKDEQDAVDPPHPTPEVDVDLADLDDLLGDLEPLIGDVLAGLNESEGDIGL